MPLPVACVQAGVGDRDLASWTGPVVRGRVVARLAPSYAERWVPAFNGSGLAPLRGSRATSRR
jgi:hypothetical protein